MAGGGERGSISTKTRNRLLHTSGGANGAPVVVAGPEKDSARFRLCVEALAEGCVQSFMHLFDISHRDPVCVDPLSQSYFSIPDDRLPWVQQQLSSVEVRRRQSEFEDVLRHCHELADYFEGERDLTEAAWHYEMALQVMMESLDRQLEQRARQAYAAFYERHGKYQEAALLYEAMYRLALAIQDASGVVEASHNLVRVYQALGDSVMVVDPAAAKVFYERAAAAAKRSHSGLEEGSAYSALGDVSEMQGKLREALHYQQNFRMVSKRDELRPQECKAALKVADLEERLGMKLAASVTLQEALALAKELGQPRQLCHATTQLGEAYRSRGQETEALQCFRESFSAAVETGDQELIDKVRIAIGFATGDFYLTHAYNGEGYLHMVCSDIRAQLAWMSEGTM